MAVINYNDDITEIYAKYGLYTNGLPIFHKSVSKKYRCKFCENLFIHYKFIDSKENITFCPFCDQIKILNFD